jgi:hypothetical protein
LITSFLFSNFEYLIVYGSSKSSPTHFSQISAEKMSYVLPTARLHGLSSIMIFFLDQRVSFSSPCGLRLQMGIYWAQIGQFLMATENRYGDALLGCIYQLP